MAIDAVRHRVLDAQMGARKEVANCLVEQHAQRQQIHAVAKPALGVEKLNLHRSKHARVQAAHLVVERCANGLESEAVFQLLVEIAQRVAAVHGNMLVDVFAIYRDFVVCHVMYAIKS